tara:strand:- start:21059 stop:21451 length:393 start_codon:yes stop_codon:yes gene_type:complete
MSKPKTMMIDDVKYIREDAVNTVPKPEGSYVIVRCRNAGVHSGYLKHRKDGVVRLENSRRLWLWWSKFSLSGLAMCGVLESNKSEVRFACVLPWIDLTELDVCEIIPCTIEAKASIESIPEHKNDQFEDE